MRFLISIILVSLSFCRPVLASFNEVDKTQVFNKNLLTNGGFENGKARWTASAGTFAVTGSSPMVGLYHATWDAAASTNTLTSTAVTIPAGMYGRNGVVSCLITTASGTATHTIQAYDGSNILSSVSVTSSTSPARASANFIFPASGSISLRLYANADEPSVAIDDCYVGPAEGYNLSSVSQAIFIGSGFFASTTNCTFTNSSTSLAALSDTDCPGPTVEVNPGPGAIQTTDANAPAFTINNLPPGRYRVVFNGAMSTSTGNLSAVAINDGTNTYGTVGSGSSSAARSGFSVEANFEYSAAGNRTFQIFGSMSSGAINIHNEASNNRVSFAIYRFPSTNEQAYNPDLIANSWSGYHDSTCSWARTNTAYGDPTADASCTLTQRTNMNFGTVSASGSVLPAVTFTPKRAGRYYVCANVITVIASTAGGVRLWDGTTVIAELELGATATIRSTQPLCGIYVVANISSVTLSLQTKNATGATTLESVNGPPVIEWSIIQIDQAIPAPVLVNSVVSTRNAVTRINSADVATTGTVSNESGDWISGNCTNADPMVCTLNSGIFSAAPHCWTSVDDVASNSYCQTSATSSTSVSLSCNTDAGSSTTAGVNKEIFCIGVP